MNRKELHDLLSGDISFIREFLNEYHEELTFPQGERITPLLEEMLHDISDNHIPESMFPRMKTLIDQLTIGSLKESCKNWGFKHDFKRYEESVQTIILRSFFVEKTYSLLKAINFVYLV